MTRYELIQTWDVETLAEFLTTIMESTEDNLLESVGKNSPDHSVTLVRLEHNMRRDYNIESLMQEYDGTSV